MRVKLSDVDVFHGLLLGYLFNSLDPDWCSFDFECEIFKYISVITFMNISSAITFRWMVRDPTDDKSTLVQVTIMCHQATSHYLNQCWLRSMMLNGITRPHWVNSAAPAGKINKHFDYIAFKYISMIDNKSVATINVLWSVPPHFLGNNLVLDQVIVWYQKPLPDPRLALTNECNIQ